MAGKLYIVGTPIGNRGDMSPRAIEVLESVDAVLAEDTRVTGKLLSSLGVEAKFERCDENVIAKRASGLVERMQAGETFAFCSDAGMPGISDPGLVLVDAARDAGVEVEVIPGPTAVTCAIAASGFNGTAFYFGGFLPRKSAGRQKLLKSLLALDATLVFYESPHRAAASAADIAAIMPARRVALCRELTKLHEEVLRLPAPQLASELAGRESIKGEIALVIEAPAAGQATSEITEDELKEMIAQGLEAGTPKSALAKQLAKETGISKSEMYNLIIESEE